MSDLLERIHDFIGEQRFAVLATQEAQHPYCSLVTYVISTDGRALYFATSRNTRKHKNLIASPHVSLLISNQTNAKDDVVNAEAVTVLGTANEVAAEEREDVLRLFSNVHEQVNAFARVESSVLIRVRIEQCIFVDQFQRVQEYRVQ